MPQAIRAVASDAPTGPHDITPKGRVFGIQGRNRTGAWARPDRAL